MLENSPSYIDNHAQTHPHSFWKNFTDDSNTSKWPTAPFRRAPLFYCDACPLKHIACCRRFPLPSFTMLQNLQRGTVNAMKLEIS